MEHALSIPAGLARQPQDFHWLERNVPCQFACPARTDIPSYLAAVARGDPETAYRINLADNVFPGVLGRVCARPCEAPCRHGWTGLGEPVAICAAKRAGADHRPRADLVRLPPLFPPTGRRVAVVGAGVAGLTAARQLALFGHEATVFEQQKRPGGMMRQGIPAFRLPRDILDLEIEQVEAAGVRVHCGMPIGSPDERSVGDLLREHDAVILAAGALHPHRPAIPGHNLQGVEHGLDFLFQVNVQGRSSAGRRVAVIGGGFTAIDCARVALRLGAKQVAVHYRRTADALLLTPGELEAMNHEGIPLVTQVTPIAFLGEAGRVRAIRMIQTRPGEPDEAGRRRPVDIPGSEYEIEADLVLLATGQAPDRSWLGTDFHELRAGYNGQTGDPRVFLAGDYATGSSSLIEAIAHAKSCALAVDARLMGGPRQAPAILIEDGRDAARTREMDAVPRHPMPERPLPARSLDAEVELGYAPPSAAAEARRCYLCHYKYEIDMSRCIYCDQCVEVKPRPHCIVKASAILKDERQRIAGWTPRARSIEPDAPPFFYWINQEDCIRCNACLDVCPVRCISVQKVSLTAESKSG